jgi:hypothetical protein
MAASETKGDPGGDPGAAERGRRATIHPDGEVHGSGAGAGGGGTPEDFDWDAASGAAGDLEPRKPTPVHHGGDAPAHNSR